MTMHFRIPLFFILVTLMKCVFPQNDFFDEELMLKPLPSNHVYAYFQFTTVWETTKDITTFQHSHLFPRGLGEIISRHNVNELHLTLTKGLWNYQKWGYPYHDAGPGAEIYSWFHEDVNNVDDEWKGLTNALAGLFCASLNFINPANSMSPEFTFRPTGVVDHSINSSHLRYSSLPKEIVCTENLTPFKKLLPCNSKKGLATLLNSAYIHNTNYHSIGVHFRVICSNTVCTKTSLELRQSVSLIYDTMTDVSQNWSVRKFFGMGIRGACPLATLSNVYIDISNNNTNQVYELIPPPSAKVVSLRGGQLNEIAVYDIRSLSLKGIFNIEVLYNTTHTAGLNYPSILYANRYVIGYGQERGSLVTKIYNNYWQTLDIILLESIPWYLPVYLHSVKIICGAKNIIPLTQRYLPGKERKSPYYLELILRLPPQSVTKFSIEMDYSFLKWQEYPPDANHGFYMGPAIITALLPIARNYTALPLDGSTITSSFNASREGYLVQLRTESLLVSLPTPDFSMPYNVICLACTAIALAFGPLHNISTKRLVLKRVEMDWKEKLLSSLMKKIVKSKKKEE
ncbi:phosphatidylinositol glycan anchor biosynthesis class T isoform X1 [Bombus vancouverensis nearcticus]|uniref:GPI transamidase component PIG-T n=1 Tax=Bombus bifarius TaxID=103933 RepID=A0A6P8M4N7_9HYME|nr:GPI transamidase component PIG-T [Bombus vancouverensis nearcticus]XP_033305394.1 GPI transamidase component PIG-T [Bombus bifarius]XP_050480650.1 GPI transamidase component PIG-T isoform X1 [Bombus huntii]XP_050480651.1 GPI transamidase component PIG-T isoform X1 [Bombus huntii]XP_050480652.1 GPI transamidase component PIG-T isoform X1 [Bombus huntii]